MDRIEAKRRQVVESLRNSNTDGENSLTVGQFMTADPRCIRRETTVLELIQMFHSWQFRHLLVLDEHQRLAGVLSDRDVLRCLGPTARPQTSVLAGITAGQIMSTDVLSIERDAPLEKAVELMLTHGVNSLPVLADGRLVGILTNTDLNIVLRVLLEQAAGVRAEQPASIT